MIQEKLILQRIMTKIENENLEGNKKKEIVSFPPYRKIDELSTSQKEFAGKFSEVVIKNIPQTNIILGFGSFWQKPDSLRQDSDIDLFILTNHQPRADLVAELGNDINENVQESIPEYKINAHLFVGEISEVANGAENFIRCLTIHDRTIDPPAIIHSNLPKFHLLNLIKRNKIDDWFQEALFNISRHFNTELLAKGTSIITNEDFKKTQQKFLQRYIQANLLAQDFFGDQLGVKLSPEIFQKYLNRNLDFQEIEVLLDMLRGEILK